MNFEDFEGYWQNRRSEGYLFDTPRSQIAADIRRSAQLRQQRYARKSYVEVTVLTIIILIALAAIALSNSLAARSGIALLAAGFVLQLAPSFRINSMERNKRYDLPQQESLIEERKRVAARIRHVKRQTTWYLLPIALGLTLLCIAGGCALDTISGFITGLVTASIAYYVYQRRQAQKTLIPIMKDIDRDSRLSAESHVWTRTDRSYETPTWARSTHRKDKWKLGTLPRFDSIRLFQSRLRNPKEGSVPGFSKRGQRPGFFWFFVEKSRISTALWGLQPWRERDSDWISGSTCPEVDITPPISEG